MTILRNNLPLAILLLTVVIVCDSAAIDDIPGGSNINGNQSSIPEDPAPKSRLGSSKYVVLSYVSVDFSGSLQTCRSYGLQPATITSQKDNIDVQDALAMSSTYGSSYWIGATNLGRPNNYLWITSNRPIWYPNGYLNWAVGQPNNAFVTTNPFGTTNCVAVQNLIGAPWIATNCAFRMGVICQDV
ncbi:hypothetical protein pipiens_002187 [Culex pipiens pipiens]|uniref:C-type lectin domain-containing protein n=1 Tax=Culex pipiens pipiens TaxID=38569 RepID=A0ABD1DIZ1_CULPP